MALADIPYHVVDVEEGVVDGGDLDAVLEHSGAEHETTDATESVDANLRLGHDCRRETRENFGVLPKSQRRIRHGDKFAKVSVNLVQPPTR